MALQDGSINNIMMISLHGYVAAEPELGKPDTGGQVVYVLELAKRFSRLGRRVDLITRRFEDQPEFDEINDNLRVWRIPFGGEEFIRKEDMHDHVGDFVTNLLCQVRQAAINMTLSILIIGMRGGPDKRSPRNWTFPMCTRPTRWAGGNSRTWAWT